MIEVKAIAPRKRDLLPFVKFPIRLYRGNPCYVPPLVLDEVATLSPDKNPAFDFCEAQCFMAYRDGKPAESVRQGELCSIKTGELIHRGDQLYKFVPAEQSAEAAN